MAQAPHSATMTWMSQTANEQIAGCHIPSFAEQLKESAEQR